MRKRKAGEKKVVLLKKEKDIIINQVILNYLFLKMLSINEIFREIRKRMMNRGVNNDQEFEDTMDEVLDEYQDVQIITDDDNVEELRQALKEKWADFKQLGV